MAVIKLIYMDGEDLSLQLDRADLTKFFQELSLGKVHWDATNTTGFWANLNAIRFAQIQALDVPLSGVVPAVDPAPAASAPDALETQPDAST